MSIDKDYNHIRLFSNDPVLKLDITVLNCTMYCMFH